MKFHTLNSLYLYENDTLTRHTIGGELRQDNKPVPVVKVLKPPTPGDFAVFVLDLGLESGAHTYRQTSIVISVED